MNARNDFLNFALQNLKNHFEHSKGLLTAVGGKPIFAEISRKNTFHCAKLKAFNNLTLTLLTKSK
jgi:hypothetical protein